VIFLVANFVILPNFLEENLEKHVCFQQMCVRCVFSPNIPHYFSEIQNENKKVLKKH
jgi:hypothetical protein